MTEKFFEVFDNVNIIPIVRGGADNEQYFHPNTFINAANYESPKQLALHLKTVVAHREVR